MTVCGMRNGISVVVYSNPSSVWHAQWSTVSMIVYSNLSSVQDVCLMNLV